MNLRRVLTFVILFALIAATPAMASQSQVKQLLTEAMGQIGAPYKLHSDAPKSFNCLSFVAYCVNQVDDGTITADGIAGDYDKVTSYSKVKAGDVVCFRAAKRKKGIRAYHFGICIGGGCFVHATNDVGKVTVSRMKDYKKRFLGAIRIF